MKSKLFTESKKYIKTYDKLGVPENITDTGEILYNKILDKLNSLDNKPMIEDDDINFNISDIFQISDYNFTDIDITITTKTSLLVKNIKIYSYAFNFTVAQSSNNFQQMTFSGDYDTVQLQIDIAIPENNKDNQPNNIPEPKKLSDLIQYIQNNKHEFIRSITHELAHAYNKFKKPAESITHRNDYQTVKQIRMEIKPIDAFLHLLYYISDIENIVRPSEVLSDMKTKNISKDQFSDYIKTNDIYKKLTKAKNFSYLKLKNKLHEPEYLKQIDNFIEQHEDLYKDEKIPTDTTDKVNLILHTFYASLIHLKMRNIQNALGLNHPFAQLFLPNFQDRIDLHNKYAAKITKQKEYDKFFEFEEKRINFEADKMIKKISKLYDMAKDNDKPNKKSTEIKDWKLYHDINKTKTEFTTELKTNNIDSKKKKK
jgi:hypothetical protein